MGAIRMRFQTADLKNTTQRQSISYCLVKRKQTSNSMDYSFKLKCVNDGFIYYKHAAFHCKTLNNGLESYWLLVFLSAVFTLILTAPIHFQQIVIFGWSVPLNMYIHWLILPNILSVVNFTLYLQLVPVAHWEQGLDPRLPWWVYSSMKLPLLCKPAGGSRWHYGGPLS